MTTFDAARTIVRDAIASRVFPAAGVDIGTADGTYWSESFGTLTFDEDSAPATHDTIFDLASLTKPIATTTVAMELVRTGALRVDARVADFFDDWRGTDREPITIRDLLEHASGLPARLVDPPPDTRREFEHEICVIKLEYEPRTRAIYSDLGFILLGFLVERLGGASLAELFERIARIRTVRDIDDVLAFDLPAGARPWAAPTLPMEVDPRRGRRLVGEVHDNYAAALGGIAGHAGLFSTAAAVGAFARAILRAARGDASGPAPFSPDLVARFTAKSIVPGNSRALGWDTMLPTSSCGTRMSPQAFGHVGFTGTSLWIDPARNRYFVLLTNRVCGGGTLDDMRTVRRAFHDALGDL